MHKPAQVELQLDRPQFPYSETLGSIIAGGSPAHYRRRQPNPTRKGPHKLQVEYFHKNFITKSNWQALIDSHLDPSFALLFHLQLTIYHLEYIVKLL